MQLASGNTFWVLIKYLFTSFNHGNCVHALLFVQFSQYLMQVRQVCVFCVVVKLGRTSQNLEQYLEVLAIPMPCMTKQSLKANISCLSSPLFTTDGSEMRSPWVA